MKLLSAITFCALLLTACIPIGTTNGNKSVDASAVAEAKIKVGERNAAFVETATAEFNQIRAASGLRPVRFDPALALAAETHARDMALGGFRSHRGSDGSSFATRARRVGATCAVAENISWGSTQSAGAYDWWMNSPPHRAAMHRRDVAKFGLAEVNRVWVLVLGRNC